MSYRNAFNRLLRSLTFVKSPVATVPLRFARNNRFVLISGREASNIGCSFRHCLTISVPTIAESINSGKIQSWVKKVGDFVTEDEVICNIESDKATVEVRAPKNGIITEINFEEGSTVNVGEKIATLKEDKGPVPPKEVPVSPPTEPGQVKQREEAPSSVSVSSPLARTAESSPPSSLPPPKEQVITVTGSDPRTHHVRISTMRQRIADRLKSSQNTAAMLTTFNEIDMTPLMKLRERYKEEFVKRHGVKLGFMSPFCKACAIALTDLPIVNASWCDETIEYHDYVDISIAVATPNGLVVPVLRDVQNMDLAQIEKKIEDFGNRAKNNKITIPEMMGGTFTISNGGTYGSWMGTPIINPPQSAIFGMHAIKKKPWVVNDQIVIRDIMAIAITYDHRIIDGRDAVSFLVKVKNLIEDPARIVLNLA